MPMLTTMLLAAALAAQDTTIPVRVELDGVHYELTTDDTSQVPIIAKAIASGRANAERFFGAPYRSSFVVRIYPSRASLTAHWAAAWGVPDLRTECWMVASGVASELAMLSPRAWDREACEHRAADTAGTRRILWHELVHVYHGQRNPRPNFDGMDDLGWFVEGLATLASGQLAAQQSGDARAAIAAGQAPARLAVAWSGRYRYGVSGSLVAWVDTTYGRARVNQLLSATTQDEALGMLQITEPLLLSRWRDWVLARQP